MSYYSILAVTPTSEDWIPDYVGSASRLVARHGGKYLARTSTHEQIEGDDTPDALRIIIEWPSKDAAKAFMSDPECVPHLKAHTLGSTSFHYLVDARDDLA